jgi:LacI family transcriptional regulator
MHREKGMTNAMQDAGIVQDPSLVSRAPMSEEHGYRSTISMLDAANRPTALLCSSIIVALGAIRALGDRGVEVGKGMSIIAHDDVFAYLKPENFRVPLTCTRSSIRRAGFRIAERLTALIDGREEPGTGEIWPVELVVRNSTARPGR